MSGEATDDGYHATQLALTKYESTLMGELVETVATLCEGEMTQVGSVFEVKTWGSVECEAYAGTYMPEKKTAQMCSDESLQHMVKASSFLIDNSMYSPMGEPAYPTRERLRAALDPSVSVADIDRIVKRFHDAAMHEEGRAVAMPQSYVGVQLAMHTNALICHTTEDLRAVALKPASGAFSDLSRPQLLKPGQAFFVGRYHEQPLTMFWDGAALTFLPDLQLPDD